MAPNPRQKWIAELKDAYARRDLAALGTAYRRGWGEPGLGRWLQLFDRIYPVGALLELCAELDRRIGEHGLQAASRWLLDTWAPGWRGVLPPSTADVISREPVLLYGNHPSMLTPFLVAAHVPRPDLRIVSASFVSHLLPHYAPYALPVELPYRGTWRPLRRGGLPRAVVAAALGRIHPGPTRDEARAGNREALARASEHLRAGGAVLIAPGGGGREGRWHTGIAHILLACTREDRTQLVPFRERNTSNRILRGALRRGRPLAARHPPEIAFSPPLPLRSLPLPADPQELTRLLEADWRRRWG